MWNIELTQDSNLPQRWINHQYVSDICQNITVSKNINLLEQYDRDETQSIIQWNNRFVWLS